MGFLDEREARDKTMADASNRRDQETLNRLLEQIELFRADYQAEAERVWRFFVAHLHGCECRLYGHTKTATSIGEAKGLLAQLYRMSQFAITVDDIAVMVDIRLGRIVQGYDGMGVTRALVSLFQDTAKNAHWTKFRTPEITARLVFQETHLVDSSAESEGTPETIDKEVGLNLFVDCLSADLIQHSVNTSGAGVEALCAAREHIIKHHTDITPTPPTI